MKATLEGRRTTHLPSKSWGEKKGNNFVILNWKTGMSAFTPKFLPLLFSDLTSDRGW